MPEKVVANFKLGIIEVNSFGRVTLEDIKGSIREIKRIHESSNFTNVLVDTRGETTFPSTFETYQFSSNLKPTFRFAVILSQNDLLTEAHKFAATVAKNRGIQFQLFDSKAAGLKWLLDAEVPPDPESKRDNTPASVANSPAHRTEVGNSKGNS